jgi:uncharacterized protein DUF6544
MWKRVCDEVASAHLFPGPATLDRASEAELAALPPAARACMRFFEVVPSKPKRWSFRLGWRGRFRMGPSSPWMRVEAVQYDSRFPVARIFHMKARMKGIFPILARDTYVHGEGHIRATVAGVVQVAEGKGPEYDAGELVTWVNDAILFAPSMLLGPDTRWSHIDARSFAIAFTDRGRTVSARVSVDGRGAPVDFETRDRYLNDPFEPGHPLRACRWSTPIESWELKDGKPLPTRGSAIWHLANGPFTYAEFEPIPESLAFDGFPPAVAGT